MLRRLSMHAAHLEEPDTNYVWENLKATSFEHGADAAFDKDKVTSAMREYAIAGTLHLAHIAMLHNSPENDQMLTIRAHQLAQALKLPHEEAQEKLSRLLLQHKSEWEDFMVKLGSTSFISKWSSQVQI